MLLRKRLAFAPLALAVLGACGDNENPTTNQEPACISVPTETCQPTYTPTFERIYTETLKRTCSQTGACHSQEGRQGGLAFTDQAESYALLLGENGGEARVKPGDPGCSKLVVRTHANGEPWQMPPGDALAPGVQCAIRTWIANGANP